MGKYYDFHNSDELYHYGRSKEDGAPGVGTGNWKRNGGGFSSFLSKFKKKKDRELDEHEDRDLDRLEKEASRREAYNNAAAEQAKKNSLRDAAKQSEQNARKAIIAEQERQAKEQQERLKKEQEEARTKIDNVKKNAKNLIDDFADRSRPAVDATKNALSEAKQTLDKKMEMNPKSKQSTDLLDSKFDKMSNDELQQYTNRLNLERNAKNAEMQAKLQKMGAPVEVAKQLISYGQTAVSAYDSYKKLKETFGKHKTETVPRFNKPLSQMTNSELRDYKNRMDLLKSAVDSSKALATDSKSTKFDKPISEMSNQELNDYKERMTLERDVRNLRNEVSHPKEYGQKTVSQQTAKSLLEDISGLLNNGQIINYDSVEEAFKQTNLGQMMGALEEIQKLERIERGSQNNQNNQGGNNQQNGGGKKKKGGG